MPDDVSLPARASNRDLQTMRFEEALELYTPSLADALPDHIPLQRFKRVLLTAVNLNPDLARVDRRSLFNSCVKCATDGLYPDGREAALVIYETSRKIQNDRGMDEWIKIPTVQYIPMIAGIRKRMRNSGDVLAAIAEVVYRNDKFRVIKGIDGRIEHEPPPLDEDRGDAVGAYAQIKLRTGEILQEVMTKKEIEYIRDTFSRGANTARSPWRTSESEMWRKTVLRRCSKSAPSDADLDRLMSRDDEPLDVPQHVSLPPPRPTRVEFTDERQQRIEDYATVDESEPERVTDDPDYDVPPAVSEEPPPPLRTGLDDGPPLPGQRRRRRTKAEMQAAKAAEAASNETAKADIEAGRSGNPPYEVIDPDGEVHDFTSPTDAVNFLGGLFAEARGIRRALEALRDDNQEVFNAISASDPEAFQYLVEIYESELAAREPDRQAQPEPTSSPPVQAPPGQRPDYRVEPHREKTGELSRAWFVVLLQPTLRKAQNRQEFEDRIADNADLTAEYMRTLQPASRIAAMKELDDIKKEIPA